MIEIGLYFDGNDVKRIIDALSSLPVEIRPMYFGDTENLKNDRDKISNIQRFEKFLRKNETGFFLFSQDCRYDLNLRDYDFSVMYIDFEMKKLEAVTIAKIESILTSITAADPVFGYAADSDERNHRNLLTIQIGQNQIEDWVGRDLKKYIPGFYWMTILSNGLIKKYDIDVTKLINKAQDAKPLDHTHFIINFFEDPADWKTYAIEIDQLCQNTAGVFSISDVKSSINGISNYLQYSDIVSEWR